MIGPRDTLGIAVAALGIVASTGVAMATLAPATGDPPGIADARDATATFAQAPVSMPGAAAMRGSEPGSIDGSAAQAAPEGYDGSYEFVRIRYESGGGGGFFRSREPEWAHDYDRADREIISVLDEVTNMDVRPDGYRVLRMDDPEVFNFPVIYLVEIGYWNPEPGELRALDAYLEKGGFLIVDDFRGGQLRNLLWIMNQVAPELEVMEVPDDHAIFDSFFRIEDPGALPTHPVYGRLSPVYLGLFEDNDPEGRLMAIFNYDNDIAEWWETFSTGFYPIDLSNEAFKFGVNYVVYAHTR